MDREGRRVLQGRAGERRADELQGDRVLVGIRGPRVQIGALHPKVIPSRASHRCKSTSRSTPPASCSESRPLVLALNMQPSAKIGSTGDYDVKGTIQYSCSGVTVEAHVLSPDGRVRWAPGPSENQPVNISLRFAASQQGTIVPYEVGVFDALGNESWPPLRQSVSLE